MTPPNFNAAAWIERLAAALEHVAAEAEPSYSPLPPDMPRSGSIDGYWSVLRRGYRDLAVRAKHDPTASIQFEESHLWVKTDPVEAMAILRETPSFEAGAGGLGRERTGPTDGSQQAV